MLKKRTPAIERIVIIGLGLMGGSLAKRIRERFGDMKVLAVDKDAMTLTKALKEGVIHLGVNDWRHYQPELGDMVVIALPSQCPDDLLVMLDHVAAEQAICVLDLASTKSGIMNRVEMLSHLKRYFIGGHPMVGKDTGGYASSMADLYNEAIFFLCSGNARPKVQEVVESWLVALECHPVRVSPEQHDRMVAVTSHFPHILSYVLGEIYQESIGAMPDIRYAVGTGFMSMSRLARSNPALWAGICASNKAGVVPLLDRCLDRLNGIKDIMDGNECKSDLEEVFRKGHLQGGFSDTGMECGDPAVCNQDGDEDGDGRQQDLSMLRSQLDHIDAEIFELLSKRFDCIRTIGAVKAAVHIPIEDTNRERRLLDKVSKKVPQRNAAVVKRLYANVFKEAKQIQGNVR